MSLLLLRRRSHRRYVFKLNYGSRYSVAFAHIGGQGRQKVKLSGVLMIVKLDLLVNEVIRSETQELGQTDS
ncbi:hypothetical protein R1flu_009683 [Riccia fluitans]|uniref:Uncharacterized protein n=1 Tax=Riccia fluitans TaxID=41844 RepID=A0ABD1Z2U3_9MARC